MKLENPFKLQNWKFRKFLIVILFFQISLLALFTLDKMEIEFPIIRPLIGFVYLSFVPGYLLLRILKLHKLSSIESFLYAIGLSLFVDMFVGFLMNMLYPPLGITDKPISEIPIILTMTGVVFLLCIIAYFRDRGYNDPDYIDLKDILNPQVLFLSLIPFMAIFGTYLVNHFNNILLIIILILLLIVIPPLASLDIFVDKHYPYILLISALSLTLHWSLITPLPPNSDGLLEMFYVINTLLNNIWEYYKFEIPVNSVPSVNIVPIIFIYLCNISLSIFYKIITPVLSIFTYIALYHTYSIVFKDKKLAFYSSYFLMCWYIYFSYLSLAMTKVMSYLFLSLTLLVIFKITNMKINIKKYMIISIIFLFSVVMSHYGYNWVSVIILLGCIIGHLINKYLIDNNRNTAYINIYLALLIIAVLMYISWQMYLAKSASFGTIVSLLVNNIKEFLQMEFLKSRTVEIVTENLPTSLIYTKYLYQITVISCLVGIISSIYNKTPPMPYKIVAIFSCMFMLLSCLPTFSEIIDFLRVAHLMMMILSPFVIFGLKKISQIITSKIIIGINKEIIVSTFLSIFLVFNSGLASNIIFNDFCFSGPLSMPKIKMGDNDLSITDILYINGKYIDIHNMYGFMFLNKYGLNKYPISADMRSVFAKCPIITLRKWNIITQLYMIKKGYILLNNINIKYNVWSNDIVSKKYININTNYIIYSNNKIYECSGKTDIMMT